MAGTMGMLKELGCMISNLKSSKKLKDCQKDCCLVHYLGTRRALKKVEMRGTQMAWTKVGWRGIQTALMMVDC
eukprot:scaffold14724_cov42-Cyclotella_meneghiniana.AAC.1